ncbi:MAG: DnaJ domain-containing protein, partial [Bdellovibrionales bacterium]|nr:DnaJ domain-containing protein [Bdellovibrionales bacterium]
NGEISSVAFSEGNISHVNVNDKTSYFGILLVEHGFTTGEEVKLSLNRPSEKPIGERLVEANALSPHAIRIIRQEQLAIRLSKTIQNSSVQVSFLEHPVHQSKDGIDRDLLTNQLNDWVLSKVTVDWLRAYFTPWLDHALLIGSKKRTEDRAIRDSQLGLTPEILKLIDDVRTVQDILNESSLDEEKSLRIIYFLLLEKIVVFAAGPVNSLDFQGKYQRLKIMAGEIEKQNHFEILGISQNAQDREINRAYLELAKALHPDKLSPRAPENVRTLQHSIFSKIAEAYDILRDRGRREIYINELTMGHADEMLHIESVFEEAHGLLFRGRYQKALAILEKIAEGKKHRTDLIVYLLWAKIKVGSLSKDSAAFIDEITYQLNLVPPEERHTPIYIYVKGLYLKMIGNVDKAYVYF